jgi:predicted metal-dependent phosphotriesterase family hydrolase
MIGRREFLAAIPFVTAMPGAGEKNPHRIQTVTGPAQATELGRTLMHEHVLVDFAGARAASRTRYDADEVFRTALPYLEKIRKLGCGTFVDCTPAYIGRDPGLLRRLSEAAGVRIVTNTGYYAAGDKYKFLPGHFYAESAEQLARRWIAESDNGIEGTGIRPGLIKIGVTSGRLPDMELKLVRAAALTHKSTGLTIASHTGDGAAALHQLEVLAAEKVPARAFIWVHAQSESDTSVHMRAAKMGAWVEFDGVAEATAARHAEFVRNMAAGGFLGRTLISQDAGWYHVGEPGGGQFRGFDYLLTGFLNALRGAGITDGQVRSLLVDNPRAALSGAIR